MGAEAEGVGATRFARLGARLGGVRLSIDRRCAIGQAAARPYHAVPRPRYSAPVAHEPETILIVDDNDANLFAQEAVGTRKKRSDS